jgi:large subunit ribosomal protein L22
MEIRAEAKHIRQSPRKTRLVADIIRGENALGALDYLRFVHKEAAKPITKLLVSVLANAEHNFKLKKENLYIKTITIDGGPMLKRSMPRAFGRATPIRKRSCHIIMILDERIVKEPAETAKEIKKKELKLAEKIKKVNKIK